MPYLEADVTDSREKEMATLRKYLFLSAPETVPPELFFSYRTVTPAERRSSIPCSEIKRI